MSNSNSAFVLEPTLIEEARKVAESEGVPLDEFINAVLAEKLSALRMESYFRERASRADIPRALQILAKAGVGNPPIPGDEILS